MVVLCGQKVLNTRAVAMAAVALRRDELGRSYGLSAITPSPSHVDLHMHTGNFKFHSRNSNASHQAELTRHGTVLPPIALVTISIGRHVAHGHAPALASATWINHLFSLFTPLYFSIDPRS